MNEWSLLVTAKCFLNTVNESLYLEQLKFEIRFPIEFGSFASGFP